MPRILERVERTVVCNQCKSNIGYTDNEIKKVYDMDSWGKQESFTENIKCPSCHKKIILNFQWI